MRRAFLGHIMPHHGAALFKDNERVVVKEPLDRAVRSFGVAKHKMVERVCLSPCRSLDSPWMGIKTSCEVQCFPALPLQ